MRLLTLFVFMLCFLAGTAHAQLTDLYLLTRAYADDIKEPDRPWINLFLDLSYTYCQDGVTPVPPHVLQVDSAYYHSSEGYRVWRGFCSNIVAAIYKKEPANTLLLPIRGHLYDFTDSVRFRKAAEIEKIDDAYVEGDTQVRGIASYLTAATIKMGQNKELLARPYLEATTKEVKDGVLLIGMAQEKSSSGAPGPGRGRKRFAP